MKGPVSLELEVYDPGPTPVPTGSLKTDPSFTKWVEPVDSQCMGFCKEKAKISGSSEDD